MNLNFRTLDLNLLRVFDQVMADRNLTRAARSLIWGDCARGPP